VGISGQREPVRGVGSPTVRLSVTGRAWFAGSAVQAWLPLEGRGVSDSTDLDVSAGSPVRPTWIFFCTEVALRSWVSVRSATGEGSAAGLSSLYLVYCYQIILVCQDKY